MSISKALVRAGEAKPLELLPRRNIYLLCFSFLFFYFNALWKSHCNKYNNFTKASVMKLCYSLFLFLFIRIRFIIIFMIWILLYVLAICSFFSNYYTSTALKCTQVRFNRISFRVNPRQTITIQIDCEGVVKSLRVTSSFTKVSSGFGEQIRSLECPDNVPLSEIIWISITWKFEEFAATNA